MKVMVVSGSEALRLSLAKTIEVLTGYNVILADHDEALIIFLDENPEAVIICEYDESAQGRYEYNRGRATYSDIMGPAGESTKIIRIGFSDYPYEDYVKVPFGLPEILGKIGGV